MYNKTILAWRLLYQLRLFIPGYLAICSVFGQNQKSQEG